MEKQHKYRSTFINTSTLIDPFTVYVNWLRQRGDGGREAWLADAAFGFAQKQLFIDDASHRFRMVAEGASKGRFQASPPALAS